ncbi:MAG: SpoIIE family protein phosphatase [Acidobacteria bacterium]|nr:SpoIIE family protein phosphatase [Acidobacteriota bacterium]
MNAVPAFAIQSLRPRILERRARLEAAAEALPADYVNDLLCEIDAALERIDAGTFGLCEVCHDTIEAARLEQNPMVRFCLDHLSGEQRRAHEQDLELATRIQSRLLPPREVMAAGWETHYRYEPAGAVGGDYCELIPEGEGTGLFFAVGDVAGKGVAASLLMTHLNAILRSLLSLELPLAEVVARANRLFCESTSASHYATLACGRTTADGVELCNAGHCRPLILRGGGAERVDPTGLPLGLFCNGRYTTRQIPLTRGDSLVLYSDGITEAQDPQDNDYDEERLIRALQAQPGADARAMAGAVLSDVVRFRAARPQHDDITLLIVRRR